MIAAVYCLHYGVEWLEWSIRSVRDFVDDIFIFYTAKPSHGHKTELVCPERREQLFSIAEKYATYWQDVGPFEWEGQHRDWSIKTVKDKGYSHALVVDADELWDAHHLSDFIRFAKGSNIYQVRVAMHHFWRSMNWVCEDDASPIRFFNLKYNYGETYYPLNKQRVFHMGYAQSSRLIGYKMQIHGHKGEFKPGWFENTFMAWQPGMGGVHPAGNNWMPQRYTDDGTLRALAKDHPYWGVELIP